MPKNKLLELIHKDRVAAAIVCAYMVVSFRRKGEEIEPERFTAAELREAINRVERSMEELPEDECTDSIACVTLAQLREQLEASA